MKTCKITLKHLLAVSFAAGIACSTHATTSSNHNNILFINTLIDPISLNRPAAPQKPQSGINTPVCKLVGRCTYQ